MKVLLVIDVQNDFCPGGMLAVAHGDAVVPTINRLTASTYFDLIVASKDWHPPGHISFASSHHGKKVFDEIPVDGTIQRLWPDHCVRHTPGAEFHPGLFRDRFARTILKGTRQDIDSYSAFFDNNTSSQTELADFLREQYSERGLEQEMLEIYVCGLALDYCVKATALDALKLGYKTSVIVDACRAVDPSSNTLDELRASGINLLQSGSLLEDTERVSSTRSAGY